MELVFLFWLGSLGIKDTINIAINVSIEVTIHIVLTLTIGCHIAAFTIPVTVMPEWILAIVVVPIAVVVNRVVSSAVTVGCFKALKPLFEILWIRYRIITLTIPVAIVPVRILAVFTVVVAR